ncbi:MAG: hypothetical protein PHI73_00495 [Patescibacteria group bacterium]|nr:hypothetical protein [Patescibacteria group bacterium]
MDHKEKLLEIYHKSVDVSDIINISDEDKVFLQNVASNVDRNKGVYTVLVTLLVHKLLVPKQDIRYFQNKMKKGFSARTLDTKFITPTLKELKLPSMAESGWLTRSLEQPYPYTLKYEGEISGKDMKKSFLRIIDSIQKHPALTENYLRFILNGSIAFRDKNTIEIKKIFNGDGLTIATIVNLLEEHFTENYKTHGGSKLPVLAFYAIYKILVSELGRYNGCELLPLGSHTASDRTSKSSGDIEVTKNGKIFESVEVKLDKQIDITMTRIAYEKIVRFNPIRYYILSYIGIKEQDKNVIEDLIKEIKTKHGCQLIVNGLLHTLRYYLRLISDPKYFFNSYIKLVENDTEIRPIHKMKLKGLIKKYDL